MFRKFFPALLTALSLWTSVAGAQTSFGENTLFNDGWTFIRQDAQGAWQPSFDDTRWRAVTLPHDWSAEGVLSPDNAACTGFLPAGIGWYRKHFSGQSLSAEKVYIYFEGVYNRSTVWLNGQLLGHRPSGYNSFMYDLTPYLNRTGDNVLAVKVDHSRKADSRWYPGSGIYRNVWLTCSASTHFSLWGVACRTAQLTDRQGVIEVETSIEGLDGHTLRLTLKDAEGRTVSQKSVKASEAQVTRLRLASPRRWDLDDPYLYTLQAEIRKDGATVDACSVSTGLRTLEFHADRGFALNGRNTKIKGVCLHHDAGVLGAAVPPEVLEYRLRTLKSLGVNAIRTSHNPQAPAFYELCDRLGLLVMDEAYDEWEFNKKKWVEGWNVGKPGFDGTADYFEEWCERDLKDMVRRDRNHPCIFLWSIGNEVDYPNDPYSHPILNGDGLEFTQPMSGGYKPDAPDAMRIGVIAEKFAGWVRSVDPSRPVTGALAGVVMSNQTAYPEAVDVVGYNYTESRYGKDHAQYPDRILYGSENRHGYAEWKAVRDNGHIFGQFLWTGADYLGEAGVWPARGSASGLLDLGNFVKPRGRYREAIWSDKPVCWLGTGLKSAEKVRRFDAPDSYDLWDCWNYEDGQTVRVVCYTNAAAARLLLNGEEVGALTPHNDETGIIGWDIPFAAGVLRAEGFDAQGRLVSAHEIRSSLRPYCLKATVVEAGAGPSACAASGLAGASAARVVRVVVEVLDEQGVPVKLADNEVTCRVEGPGRLLGLESGNIKDVSILTDNAQRVFKGRLAAYIRLDNASEGQAVATQANVSVTPVTVKFSSPLLRGCTLTLE